MLVSTDTRTHWVPARCAHPAWDYKQHPPDSSLVDVVEPCVEQLKQLVYLPHGNLELLKWQLI